jgi:hypothetical protein
VLSSNECRKLADEYRAKAQEPGLASNKATVLRNVAHSLSALAGQLETLTLYDKALPEKHESMGPRIVGR